MKEIRDIIEAFKKAKEAGLQMALATVVHVEGSSYRRPGARMLITEDGELTGAISGGCLEGDALRKALHVMQQQKSMLVTYDTMDDDDAIIGVGLGCNGIIQVLLEPIDLQQETHPITMLEKIAAKREPAVLATLFSLEKKFDSQIGTCLLLHGTEIFYANNINNELGRRLQLDAESALQGNESTFKQYLLENGDVTAFIELIKPALALIIFGAGNDVFPLVEMAQILGWDTTVIDGRSNYAKAGRFGAGCQMMVSKPENALEKINIDEQTVFLLMTHNYNYDLAILQQLLLLPVAFIGMLGPRKKLQRMLDELREKGMILESKQLYKIHSPVGLAIGAETSEEIALSIVAEIKASFSGKKGEPLRINQDAIHTRHQIAIETIKLK